MSAEENASLWSRLSFSWVNDLIKVGNERKLEYSDLYPTLPRDAAHLQSKKFHRRQKTHPQEKSVSMWYNLYRIHQRRFIICILFSLIQIVLSFLPSFILMLLLKAIASQDMTRGLILVSLLFLTPVANALVEHQFAAFMGRLALRVESAIQTSIYQKVLKLSHTQYQKMKTGEILNLLASDAFKLGKFVAKIYYLWQSPLMIILAYCALFYFIGKDAFIGFLSLIFLFPLSLYCGRVYSMFVERFMRIRDERIKIISETLHGMKIIKYFTWEDLVTEKISASREKEIGFALKVGLTEILQSVTTKLISLSGVIFTISMYALSGGSLEIEKVFTNLSFFNLLENPLTQLTDLFSEVTNAIISEKRISRFLSITEEYIAPELTTEPSSDPDDMILMEKATFQWEKNRNVLTDIDLVIKRKSLNLIIGPVGCGKSSLLSAICGELPIHDGKLRVFGEIAYCTQTPWITTGTIRENILFGRDYNKDLYDKVCKVCQLEKDLADLKMGDMTVIGELGANLSGGQKHRISLARACYSDKDILLLDSPLSALDSHVGAAVFEECICKFLKNKTVLLVTSSLQYMDRVDHIFALSNGRLISNQDKEFHEIIDIVSTPKMMPLEQKKIKREKIDDEEILTQGITLKDYQDYFGRFGYWFYLCVLALLTASLLRIAIGAWLSIWSEDKYQLSMQEYCIVYIGIGVLNVLILPVQKLFFIMGGVRAGRLLHGDMLRSILYSPLKFFEETPVGRILNRFSEDMYRVDYALHYIIQIFLGYLTFAAITLILIVILSPLSILFIFPVGICYYYVFYMIRKPYLAIKKFTENSRSPIISHFASTIHGLATIRSYKHSKRFNKQIENLIDYHQRSRWSEVVFNRWISLRMEILSTFIVFGSAFFFLILSESIDPALCALGITYSLTISDSFNWALRFFIMSESGIVNSQRIVEYCHLPSEKYQGKNHDIKDWPSKGEINFLNLKMKYRPKDDFILKGLTAKIEAHQSIGICGRTAAGKSTLFTCLMRIAELTDGAITIDGIDISTIDLKDLRSRISIIPQDPILFSGTLRFNLDPFDKYTDTRIWEVLENVNMKDKVKSMPNGLMEAIEEGGNNLSLGEKQLLCFARAILSENKIILLDEATAQVDEETEKIIQHSIEKVLVNKTVLIIAHRLKTIIHCNKIMVLKNGSVLEFDSPVNLLNNSKSEFSAMMKNTK